MDQKGQAQDPGRPEKGEQAIAQDGPEGVQGMVPNAAAPDIENGISQKVVQIQEDSGQKDQGYLDLSALEEHKGDDKGKSKMDAVMEQVPNHPKSPDSVLSDNPRRGFPG